MGDPLGQECSAETGGGKEDLSSGLWTGPGFARADNRAGCPTCIPSTRAFLPQEHRKPRSLLVFGDVLRGWVGCYREWRVPGINTGTERGRKLMATAVRLKILYGEGDGEAQATMAAALEKAGHTVEKAVGRKAVEEAIGKARFDLLVLGPTLSRNDRHHLPYTVKKAQAEVSVLVMHADGSRHPYVDGCTDTGASVENVLARIEGMAIAGMMPAAAAAGR